MDQASAQIKDERQEGALLETAIPIAECCGVLFWMLLTYIRAFLKAIAERKLIRFDIGGTCQVYFVTVASWR